jgi:sortase B
MNSLADSFGTYGAGSLAPCERAAQRVDRVVTLALAIVLLLIGGVAAYSLWDQFQVLEGTDVSQYKPGLGFGELLKKNPDVCAWIKVDGTRIDYPIVRGKDDFEYLEKDVEGKFSASGSLFLDSACSRNFDEPYEVVYGHHMDADKMFGDLDKFLSKKFFNSHKSATLYLPSQTLQLEVVGVIQADAYDGTIFSTPANAERRQEVEDRLKRDAKFLREDSLGKGSPAADGSGATGEGQIIALSTCADVGANTRTIVMCRVVSRKAEDNSKVGK